MKNYTSTWWANLMLRHILYVPHDYFCFLNNAETLELILYLLMHLLMMLEFVKCDKKNRCRRIMRGDRYQLISTVYTVIKANNHFNSWSLLWFWRLAYLGYFWRSNYCICWWKFIPHIIQFLLLNFLPNLEDKWCVIMPIITYLT